VIAISHDAASVTAEVNKISMDNDTISSVDFLAVAIETSDVWGQQAF